MKKQYETKRNETIDTYNTHKGTHDIRWTQVYKMKIKQ